MAKLYFLDEDMVTIKTVANIDSPTFEGTPTTESSSDPHNDRDVLNVQDVIAYVDEAVQGFNNSRVLKSNSNVLEGLELNEKYIVSVYGKFDSGTSDTYDIGPVAVKDIDGNLIKTSGGIVKNMINPKCLIPQNAVLIIEKSPETIKGLVNYNPSTDTGIDATYMMAIRLS